MSRDHSQDQADLKFHNLRLVLDAIRAGRGVSRADVVKITRMSTTGVTRIISRLLEMGLIREGRTTVGHVGRRALLFEPAPDAFYVLAIDIGARSLKLGIYDFDCRPVVVAERPLSSGLPLPDMIGRCAGLYERMLEEHHLDRNRVVTIGVTCAGLVDQTKGILRFSSPLHLENADLRQVVADGFGRETVIENDVKAALTAEISRDSRYSRQDVAYLTVGPGVGSAVAYQGEILRGSCNGAGEIGHTTVSPHGNLCDCGRHGCLQTFLTDNSLLAAALYHDRSVRGIPDIREQYLQGKKWAEDLANTVCEYLAVALNNLACMYNPDIIIVGGGLFDSFPELYDRTVSIMEPYICGTLYSSFRVVRARLGPDAVLQGGAVLAQEAHLAHLLNSDGRSS